VTTPRAEAVDHHVRREDLSPKPASAKPSRARRRQEVGVAVGVEVGVGVEVEVGVEIKVEAGVEAGSRSGSTRFPPGALVLPPDASGESRACALPCSQAAGGHMEDHGFPSRSMRRLSPGEVLFEEGSVGKHMYVVHEGQVRIGRRDSAEPLALLGRGEMFGELALLDDQPRSASAVAGTEGASLVEVDHALFIYLVGQQPAFALMVMQSMAHRLRGRLQAAGLHGVTT
jgi:CRP/FNR family cyclic AMP-dependent transcriptional regulator